MRWAMARSSPRTLVLMALALLSAGWFQWRMQPRGQPRPAQRLQLVLLIDGGTP